MKKYAGIYGLIILLIVSFAWGQTVTNPYPIPFSYLDTDTALTANSDTKVPSQKAIKTYVGSASTTGSANSLKSPATTGLLTATGMGAGTTRAKTVRDADDTLLELGGSYTPSATWNWTSATVTWPTFNQSTTGTAAHGTTWGPYAGISGPTQARTFTLPDAAATLLYDGKASGAFGTASSATGSVLLYNSGNANAFTLQPGATGAALSWTFPIAAPSGNNYLVNASTAGVLSYTDPATFSPVAGSASIATVGTVTLGTWNSTRVASAYGGTPGITVGESGYTTFAGAVATLNSAGTNTRLTLPTTLNEAISSNLTSNSNIGISQIKGANLTINTGVTLTINGPYDGDLSQKFTCQAAGSESLTNGTLTTASDKWTATNECTFAGNNATWSYVAGGASTLTQAQADLTIVGVGSHWYAFTYTVSGSTATPTASITTAFAATSTALDLTNGIHITYFLSATVPANFVITSTLTAGQAFVLDNLSLVQDAGRVVFGAGSIKEVFCEWWGGKADNSTLNQTAINAAGISLSSGGKVKLNDGIYQFSNGIRLPQYVELYGNGNSSVLYLADNSTLSIDPQSIGYYPMITNAIWDHNTHQVGVRIHDLKLNGNRANQSQVGQKGIHLWAVDKAVVDKVWVTGTKSEALRTERCIDGSFCNNWVDNFNEDGILAFALNYYCHYDNNFVTNGLDVTGVAIESEGRVGTDYTNFHNYFCSFNGNNIYNTAGKGMLIDWSIECTAKNNIIYQTGAQGLTILGSSDIDASGNIISDCGITIPGATMDGFSVTGESYGADGINTRVTATNIHASYCSGYGINISGQSGSYLHNVVKINNCVTNNNTTGDIYLTNVNNVTEQENYGSLAVGSNITYDTTSRGHFNDLTVTNAIAGSVTGNSGSVTSGVYTNAANSMSLINPLTTIAESWIGPSSTAGVYFKAGNVGFGLVTPQTKVEIYDDQAKTTFTGDQRQGLTITGSQTTNSHTFINFRNTSRAEPMAAIAAQTTSSGSFLKFGTSNNFGNGVTTIALSLDPNGIVNTPTTYSNVVTGSPVLVSSTGDLGVATSSEKYKNQITSIDDVGWVYQLDPKTFVYKNDKSGTKQYGLIAEDVDKINKDFVFYDKDGKPDRVRYEQLIPVLVKIIQEHQQKIRTLEIVMVLLVFLWIGLFVFVIKRTRN